MLLATTLWGTESEEYVPCEKTYVHPYATSLEENKILIQKGDEYFQVSTLYSDADGLYYTDILCKFHDPMIDEDAQNLFLDNKQADETLSLLPEIDADQHPLLEQCIENEITKLPTKDPKSTAPTSSATDSKVVTPSAPPPLQEKPTRKKGAWPYTNKQR